MILKKEEEIKISKMEKISAKNEKIIIEKVSTKRCKITIKDEFITNFYGKVMKITYAFSLRKNGKWIQVSGNQELTEYKG